MSALTRNEYLDHCKISGCNDNTCSFCGQSLFEDSEKSTGGVVLWAGPDLVLHQACAEHLGMFLIQDARMLINKVKVRTKIDHEGPREFNPKQ